VYSGSKRHVFTAADKNLYVPVSRWSEQRRRDVDAATGSPDGSSVNGSNPIASDGVQLFSSGGQYGGSEPASGCTPRPLSDPKMWTPSSSPNHEHNGGSTIVYDPGSQSALLCESDRRSVARACGMRRTLQRASPAN